MISTALAFCLAVQLAAPGDATPAVKIGFVDREEFYKTPRVEKILNELRDQVRESEAEFERRMDEYEKEARDLELQRIAMDEEAVQKKEAELKDMRDQVLQYLRDERSKLDDKREEKLASVVDEIRGVVRVVAQEQGYTLVLWKSALAYGSRDHDLTQVVLKRFLEEGGGQ